MSLAALRLLGRVTRGGNRARPGLAELKSGPSTPCSIIGRHKARRPRLAGLIVMLCLRYRLSRAKVQELLWELLGLQLSAGLIDQTIQQSAGQVAAVEDLLLE